MATSPMKPSTLRLSEVARRVVVPQGVVSTGWPAVRGKCRELGITFRWWQAPIGQIVLSKRADGKYAATIGGTGLSIPRQVGKTFLVGAIIFALCLLHPNLTVIWTAHRLRTAEETFGKMQKFAKRKQIAPHILKVILGSGEESVEFRNGSRILFGARERGFGRGFDEVDVVIYDEAQILGESALDDIIPAMNQSRQAAGALLLFMGTPPKPTDPGEVFTRMRTEALSGEDADTGWVEFGADPDFKPTPLPAPLSEADWRQVAKANPSYPDDTPQEAILRMRKKLDPASLLREGFGVWDEVTSHKSLIPKPVWAALVPDPDDPDETRSVPDLTTPPAALGLDMSPQRTVAISGCWAVDHGFHGEVLSLAELDTTTAVEWLKARAGRRIPVVVDNASPAAAMIPALEKARVKVVVTNAPDMGKACGSWFDLTNEGRVTHAGQKPLDLAVAGALKRAIGKSGLWGLDRTDLDLDLSPLVSFALALFGAAGTKARRTAEPKRAVVASW